MRRLTTAVLSIAVLALALPAFATAGLPRTSDPLIVPGKSLGGVKLGMSFDAARKTWGRDRGNCIGFSCGYGGNSELKGLANFYANSKGIIYNVTIRANADSDGDVIYPTKLAKFKTKSGIGLGSKSGAVKRAYPKAVLHKGDSNFFSLGRKDGSGPQTEFFLDEDNKVYAIDISNYSLGS